MKIYLAGGWFSENMLKAITEMEEVLDSLPIAYFNPRKANLAECDDNITKLDYIFKKNVEEIDNCNLVIASTVDKDMGTIWETGYAYAKNKPIIYYNPFMESREKFNLMLARSGLGICINKSELFDFLNNLIKYEYKGNIE
jgi:nucleoside 2-deoxyribosyltransferase